MKSCTGLKPGLGAQVEFTVGHRIATCGIQYSAAYVRIKSRGKFFAKGRVSQPASNKPRSMLRAKSSVPVDGGNFYSPAGFTLANRARKAAFSLS